MPGTCTRMRSAPWRWIDGSRVPVSSTRRRMISRLCCIVRASIAAFSACVSVTTSVSPSARTSNSRLAPPVIEKTGCAAAATASSAASMPAGWPSRTCSSSGGPSSRRTVPTWSRRSRSRSRSGGPQPLDPLGIDLGGLHLHQHMRAAAQVEPEIDQPLRQPARPERRVRLELRRRRGPGRDGGAGVVRPLDPAIEGVRQRDQDAEHGDPDDQHPLPERKVQHVRCRPLAARGRPPSRLGRLGLADHLADRRAHHPDLDVRRELDLDLALLSSTLVTLPIIPPAVTTWSPRRSASTIARCSFTFFCCGRIISKYMMTKIRMIGTKLISPPAAPVPPAGLRECGCCEHLSLPVPQARGPSRPRKSRGH